MVRAYCNVAKVSCANTRFTKLKWMLMQTFGEKQSSMLEKPKKIFVFLNRAADNS